VALLSVIALLALLLSVALVHSGAQHRGMKSLVEITAHKTMLLDIMRGTLWERTASLERMQQAGSSGARDQLHAHFTDAASRYRSAAGKLSMMGSVGREANILSQLRQRDRFLQPTLDSAMRLILGKGSPTLISAAIQDVSAQQNAINASIGALMDIQQARFTRALAASSRQNSLIRKLLPLTALGILALIGTVFLLVTRHLAAKNQQLAYHHAHDPLTGLINRREFEARLDRLILQARSRPATHALLYLDLDQFKLVNDSCSHAAGDELLRQITALLLGTIRQRDTLGRLGGDEFGLLLENCPLGKAVELARKLQQTIDAFQYRHEERSFSLGASIGVVPIDEHTAGIGSAMSAADAACYIAKESGRNRVQIAYLGDRLIQQHQGEMLWASRLEKALEEDRFALYFQPVVPCAGGNNRNRHIEILLRLIDEDGTLIRPGIFYQAAEKYNLAAQIDRWVITRVMDWQARQLASGTHAPPTITINLSEQTLRSNDMLKFIIRRAEHSGISPQHIIFEISESKVTRHISSTTNFMLTLRGCGFRFSLDKFGSGLSTFTYLKKLPIDYLKIDGTLVRDILADPVDYAMVRSLNELAQLLGKETVAEYVESLDIADELRSIGINYAQGCAYATPAPLSNFIPAVAPRLVVVSS